MSKKSRERSYETVPLFEERKNGDTKQIGRLHLPTQIITTLAGNISVPTKQASDKVSISWNNKAHQKRVKAALAEDFTYRPGRDA